MEITAHNLTKRYGRKTVVDDASFTVQPGRVTGFLGPNGAGKSTTMRMLLGLHRPNSGHVLVGGKPLIEYPNPLSVVGSVLDAKAFNPRNTPRQHLRAQAATHSLGNVRVEDVLELAGLASVADKPIRTFSLGMNQRLSIANALLGDPQILVLDEPINGLDAEGVRWVRDTLRDLAAQGRTILLSSHLMDEMAKTADHIIVIGRGRVLADASVGEILAGAGGRRVRIRSADLARLLPLLPSGVAMTQKPDELTVILGGIDSDAIGELAVSNRIRLSELTPIQSSLEDAYLDLTASAVEYTTGTAA